MPDGSICSLAFVPAIATPRLGGSVVFNHEVLAGSGVDRIPKRVSSANCSVFVWFSG